MKTSIITIILVIFLGDQNPNNYAVSLEEIVTAPHSCTIGVASGSATQDGRPLLWKTRDWIEGADMRIRYSEVGTYAKVMVSRTDRTWPVMGVNEKGFAVVFSLSDDLSTGNTGMTSMSFMTSALENCATVTDLEELLDSTNITGRRTENNFAAIDSTGSAKIFEVGGSQYWSYDANDPEIAPDGYLVRTNFAPEHGTNSQVGIERYLRSNDLVGNYILGDSLNYKTLLRDHMRDFADPDGVDLEIPFPDTSTFYPYVPLGGYVNGLTIANFLSHASSVIHGVLPDENPLLSTMWTIMGMPATSIAIPYWPIGDLPDQVSGNGLNEMAEAAQHIRTEIQHEIPYVVDGVQYEYIDTYGLIDGEGGGIWPIIYPVEDEIFQSTEDLMAIMREGGVDSVAMSNHQISSAATGVSVLEEAYEYLLGTAVSSSSVATPIEFTLSQNFPNPFNATTKISVNLPLASLLQVSVTDILGRQVAILAEGQFSMGNHPFAFNGDGLSSGIYFIRATVPGQMDQVQKVVLIK